MTVFLLFLHDEFLGVYDCRLAAEKDIERYRDGCQYPPDFEDFKIMEKVVRCIAG